MKIAWTKDSKQTRATGSSEEPSQHPDVSFKVRRWYLVPTTNEKCAHGIFQKQVTKAHKIVNPWDLQSTVDNKIQTTTLYLNFKKTKKKVIFVLIFQQVWMTTLRSHVQLQQLVKLQGLKRTDSKMQSTKTNSKCLHCEAPWTTELYSFKFKDAAQNFPPSNLHFSKDTTSCSAHEGSLRSSATTQSVSYELLLISSRDNSHPFLPICELRYCWHVKKIRGSDLHFRSV